MTLYETLKLLHVLAAIVWVGGGVFQTVSTWRAMDADPVHRLGLARDMRFAGDRVFGPASLLALVFGIWMVVESPAIGWGDTWIVIGLAGIVISGAIGGAFFAPKSKALVARLEAGEDASALMRTIGKVSLVDMTILLIVVWAMVTRPGA
ncbi:MAG TPA: DUF2269 family protein [Acidimicrobiia bacterium]|nr:DUF2269 family protein [Acidimicrobiia bacterium]